MISLIELSKNHARYKWFVTSSGKMVIGGKSAAQNDELLKKVTSLGTELIVMHTADPGSPFSVVLASPDKLKESDLEECATFTACFSQSWKRNKKQTAVHIFSSTQLYKSSSMAQGTWMVKGSVKKKVVQLALTLKVQKGVLRAVPATKQSKKVTLIVPGTIAKEDMPAKLSLELSEPFSTEEVLAALPAGKMRLVSST